VLDVVGNMLVGLGCVVRAANGAVVALELVAEASPDVLVTDVVMPDVAGPVLARQAREKAPGIRVLFLTGHAPDLSLSDGEGLLAKPFTLQQLADQLLQLLRGNPRNA
jgi:two-component system cell cycle sensor histidine kinase/response regulator CckA